MARTRALVGADRLVGLSTHTPRQIDQARGVDYIGVGPVNATPTKPGRPAVGPELVRYAAESRADPVLRDRRDRPGQPRHGVAAGANRIAVVRALTLAKDPETTARELRAELHDGREGARWPSVTVSEGASRSRGAATPSATANGAEQPSLRARSEQRDAAVRAVAHADGPGERPWRSGSRRCSP